MKEEFPGPPKIWSEKGLDKPIPDLWLGDHEVVVELKIGRFHQRQYSKRAAQKFLENLIFRLLLNKYVWQSYLL